MNSSRTLQEGKRIAPLDGIRGLAALSIMAWHYGPSIIVAPIGSFLAYAARLLSLSWVGVDVFFVLSGYLIGSILLRERESGGYYRVFYARRALRILPLYYLILLGFFFFTQIPALRACPAFAGWFNGLPIWSYWLFVQNFFMAAADQFGTPPLGVTWSLAVEEQFYLILPFVIKWLAPRHLPYFLIPAILAAPVLRFYFSGMERYVLLPFRMDGLLSGVLVAWGLSQPVVAAKIAVRQRLIAVLAGVLALFALPLLKEGAGLAALHTATGWLLHLWIAIVTASVVLLIVLSPPSARWLGGLDWFPLRWAGQRAYGIYLIHPWMLFLAFAAFGSREVKLTPVDGTLEIMVAAAATFLAAEVSFRWLERPLLRLGHGLRYQTA